MVVRNSLRIFENSPASGGLCSGIPDEADPLKYSSADPKSWRRRCMHKHLDICEVCCCIFHPSLEKLNKIGINKKIVLHPRTEPSFSWSIEGTFLLPARFWRKQISETKFELNSVSNLNHCNEKTSRCWKLKPLSSNKIICFILEWRHQVGKSSPNRKLKKFSKKKGLISHGCIKWEVY